MKLLRHRLKVHHKKQKMFLNFMNHYVQLDILSLWETPNKQALANIVLRSEI